MVEEKEQVPAEGGEGTPPEAPETPPVELYDAEGNKVEGALAPEQAKQLQEDVQTKEEELNKLKDKDFNFGKFRKASTEEKEKMTADWSETEKSLMGEIEELRGQVAESDKRVKEESTAKLEKEKNMVLEAMAGENEELKTKIEEYTKVLGGEVKTKEDVRTLYERAFTLLKKEQPNLIPTSTFAPTTQYTPPQEGKKEFAKTDKGKETYKNMFGHEPGSLKKKE